MSIALAADAGLIRLGFACLDAERFAEAEQLGRAALEEGRRDISVWLLIGLAAGAMGQPHRAAPILHRVAQARPDMAHPCRDLAAILARCGGTVAVLGQYRASLDHAPDDVRLRYAYADYLHETGDPAAAVSVLRPAMQLRPDFSPAYNLLGIALYDLGEMPAAICAFRQAIAREPTASVSWSNLGMALKTEGAFDAAIAAYDAALARSPGDRRIRLNRAVAMLRAGRMAEAWPDYEARLPGAAPAGLSAARLLPSLSPQADLTGRTILVRHEEGFGDTMQFCRYLPMLAERGARVLVAVPWELHRLFAAQDLGQELLDLDGRLPPHDWHCAFFSLPRVFGTELESIPASLAYLRADPALVQRWAPHVPGADQGLRIGLAWAGQARPWLDGFIALDRRRSMTFAAFAPLLDLPGACWISLQKGPAADQPPQACVKLHDPMPDVADFADTAAIVAGLDLVVSVDTAVAHLAAAMGKPVLLLDRYDSCWRWLDGRSDSPWYPTLRILRQHRMGDWSAVLAALRPLLAERIAAR